MLAWSETARPFANGKLTGSETTDEGGSYATQRDMLKNSSKQVPSLADAQKLTGLTLPDVSAQLSEPVSGFFVDSSVGKRPGDTTGTHNIVVAYGDQSKVFRESGSSLFTTRDDWYASLKRTMNPAGVTVVQDIVVAGIPMIAWSPASQDETMSPDGKVVSGWSVNNSEVLWYDRGEITYVSAMVDSYQKLLPSVEAVVAADKARASSKP